MCKGPAHYDVTALHETHWRVRGTADAACDVGHPRARGIDEGACCHVTYPARAAIDEIEMPKAGLASRRSEFGARGDLGTVFRRVDRVQDDQTRILDPTVGVFEGAAIFRAQRLSGRVRGEIDVAGRGQDLAARAGGRRRTARDGSARPVASPCDAEARTGAAKRCEALPAAEPHARVAPHRRAGTDSTRGSAGRRGSAWSSRTRLHRPDRPSRRGRPKVRGRRHRARFRTR